MILGITYIKGLVLHGASREVLLGGHKSYVHCPGFVIKRFGMNPSTSLRKGLKGFVDEYKCLKN